MNNFLKGAIDLHLHTLPCLMQRSVDDFQVAQLAKDCGMAAIVIKSHHESTVSRAHYASQATDFPVFAGLTPYPFRGGPTFDTGIRALMRIVEEEKAKK